MAYVTARTWTTGELVTAAMMNQDVRDNSTFLANPPACRVTQSGTQAIPTGTATAITFETEVFDTAAMHDGVTNPSRITFPVAGLYVVSGYVEWELTASGTYRQSRLRTNGAGLLTTVSMSAATLSTNTAYETSVSGLYKAAVNDYVELVVQHDRGSNLNANTACWMAAAWVGLG